MHDEPYCFCTLFDRNYLSRALALYHSLERQVGTGRFTLHALCMDDESLHVLTRLALPSMRPIALRDFEDPALLVAKENRSAIEYYWTCTPSLPLDVLRRAPDAKVVTYVDADLYFYADPAPLFEEMGSGSVMIHEHRFPPRLAHYAANGIYNVGWVSFRRDATGLACATRWRDQCNEWCYYRLEGDRLGDQKYLDTWTHDFPGVHVMRHKGGGLAPWNIEQYEVTRDETGRVSVDNEPLIFYHFHGMRLFADGTVQRAPGTYLLRPSDVELVYTPYELELRDAQAEIRRTIPDFAYGLERPDAPSTKDVLIAARQGERLADATRARWGLRNTARNVLRSSLGAVRGALRRISE